MHLYYKFNIIYYISLNINKRKRIILFLTIFLKIIHLCSFEIVMFIITNAIFIDLNIIRHFDFKSQTVFTNNLIYLNISIFLEMIK